MSETRAHESLNAQDSSVLKISWRNVGIGSATLAIALGVTLGLVINPDASAALASIALALAIIAFVVQIIAFMAQSWIANLQLLRAEELNSATLRALATIEEKTEGTRRQVETINEQMLNALLGKALPEASAKGVDVTSPEGSRYVSRVLSDALSQRQSAGGTARIDSVRDREKLPVPEGETRVRAVEGLDGLSANALSSLRRLGRDRELQGPFDSAKMSHGFSAMLSESELYARGLVKRVRSQWWGERNAALDTQIILTPLGESAYALLLHADEGSLEQEVRDARARLQKEDRDMEEYRRTRESRRIPVSDE